MRAVRTDTEMRGVLEPILEDYSFVTPRDAGARIFAVSVKYRINGYDRPGKMFESWTFTGYGSVAAPTLAGFERRAAEGGDHARDARCGGEARGGVQGRCDRARSPPRRRHDVARRSVAAARLAARGAAQAPPACPGPLEESGGVTGIGSKYVWANFTSAVSSGLPSLRRGR